MGSPITRHGPRGFLKTAFNYSAKQVREVCLPSSASGSHVLSFPACLSNMTFSAHRFAYTRIIMATSGYYRPLVPQVFVTCQLR